MAPRYGSEKRTIYRSREDKVLCGVCGGIAEHFDFAAWGVRCIFALLILTTFPIGLIVYIVMGCAMKQEPARHYRNEDERDFWDTYRSSRTDALRKVERTFDKLDKRLQRMESVVTAPNFGLEDEYERL